MHFSIVSGRAILLLLFILYINELAGWVRAIRRDDVCDAGFGATIEDDMKKIKSIDFSMAAPYLNKLKPIGNPEIYFHKNGVEIPVMATAASSNHYDEAGMLIENLNKVVRPAYPSMQLYFFDIGLKDWQREQIRKSCKCTVVEFQFDDYPAYFKNYFRNYCWKPVIIKTVLQTKRFIMWMDTSVRFKTDKLDPLFIKAKQGGILSSLNENSIAAHTMPETFQFLQEEPCLFRNYEEFTATFLLIHSDHVAYDYLVVPWVSCALIEDCMKTKRNSFWIQICSDPLTYHNCHRFDQSVLAILMYRLFHRSYLNHTIDGSYYGLDRTNDLKNEIYSMVGIKQKH